ncbi:MAG: hypothetical protein MPK75_01590 [Alphaproteobacteria bacterium]|nr:hypothetical protein [Alphaproteobacteria bacterium]
MAISDAKQTRIRNILDKVIGKGGYNFHNIPSEGYLVSFLTNDTITKAQIMRLDNTKLDVKYSERLINHGKGSYVVVDAGGI